MSSTQETSTNKFSKAFKVIDDELIMENCVTDVDEKNSLLGIEQRHYNKVNFKRIVSISFSFQNILKIQNLMGLTNLKV